MNRAGEMTKSVCAFEIRNIRYIVEAQGLNPQQNPQQGATIRYMVDGQGLRYGHFLATERQDSVHH
jgi:hypothetical protein